jgi:hypothetical protein
MQAKFYQKSTQKAKQLKEVLFIKMRIEVWPYTSMENLEDVISIFQSSSKHQDQAQFKTKRHTRNQWSNL